MKSLKSMPAAEREKMKNEFKDIIAGASKPKDICRSNKHGFN
ncbi:MAG: hypothetical protein ACUVTD_04830 [Nitrososphaerales archaeon]